MSNQPRDRHRGATSEPKTQGLRPIMPRQWRTETGTHGVTVGGTTRTRALRPLDHDRPRGERRRARAEAPTPQKYPGWAWVGKKRETSRLGRVLVQMSAEWDEYDRDHHPTQDAPLPSAPNSTRNLTRGSWERPTLGCMRLGGLGGLWLRPTTPPACC